jgi:poly(hydroxyalkanoate) depolymerase family esterase
MSLWSRLKARLSGKPAEPAPGRWVEGAKTSVRGLLALAPWMWPRRRYRLYLPRGWSRWVRAPLIVLCHGCRQTPEEFARGTRIAALADRVGAMVLMPEQTASNNPLRCWNWFDAWTARGRGEAAIVAAMATSVRRWNRADPARVVAAGMSAGGALCAILGLRYPALFRGVVVHSGLACGAASSVATALTVMGRGPDADVEAIARDARRQDGDVSVRLLAIQGKRDDVVAPRNALVLARQYLVLNGVPVPKGADSTLPDASADAQDTTDLLRTFRVRDWTRDGSRLVRLVEVEGLAHAWSGGDGTLPYNDPQGPDATALVGEWLASLPA